MRLIYIDTKKEVKEGDIVTIQGGRFSVIAFDPPHKPSSEGKVVVGCAISNGQQEYYVSVIGAEWIERADRLAFHDAF